MQPHWAHWVRIVGPYGGKGYLTLKTSWLSLAVFGLSYQLAFDLLEAQHFFQPLL